MAASKLAIVWMRRNLRLEDNRVIFEALRSAEQIFPIFIFDTTILKKFPHPQDRRLSFIANILHDINVELNKFDAELTVFHGNPIKIVPKLAKFLNAEYVFADEDYEPENIERDEQVKSGLTKDQSLQLFVDHLLLRPDIILKNDGGVYKKFTPYMKVYKDYIADNQDDIMAKYSSSLKSKVLTDVDFSKSGLEIVDLSSPEAMLKQIGYEFAEDDLWHPSKAKRVLNNFMEKKIKDYKTNRDYMCLDGTSTLSPYLRFGVISIRECLNLAYGYRRTIGGDQWINELLWREFYASILFHFPDVATLEFQEKYRNKIKWETNEEYLERFKEGRTGFPIVDAAVRQLLQEGWMHNRCRMIVSSFLVKNMFIDWREGEEFFAQYLMDYDLSSNNGGWQWSSSVGTDSQPYFRIFNPYSQSEKYDPDGIYIKKYLPELKDVPAKMLHSPNLTKEYKDLDYPKPIVDYSSTRQHAINYFKQIT